MPKKRYRRKGDDSPIWSCSTCIAQFVGGPRCTAHNPTPEQREAAPEMYARDRLLRHVRDHIQAL